MNVVIHRERLNRLLDPKLLADELREKGYIVFVSGRLRQRDVATVVQAAVESDMSSIVVETTSPSECMVLVDEARWAYRDIVQAAILEDQRYEAAQE